MATLPIILFRWYAQALVKYAVFSGRAGYREFWSFVIVTLVTLYALDSWGSSASPWCHAYSAYMCFLLMPSLSITVRRAHDINLRAWWLLLWIVVPLLLFIGSCYLENFMFPVPYDEDPEMIDEPFCVLPLLVIFVVWPLLFIMLIGVLCLPGTKGTNRFGPAPREAGASPKDDNASTP